MIKKRYLVRTIQGRSFSSVACALAITLATVFVSGQSNSARTLERLASSYRKDANAKDRAALLHFAADNNRNQNGALARLALARVDLDQGRPEEAITNLDRAASQLATISDYLLFLKGMAHYRARDFARSASLETQLLQEYPDSPLRTDAAIVAARARLEEKQPDEAIRILKTPGVKARQPEFDFLLGRAYLERGDLALAATYLQQVETNFPVRKEAKDAQIFLAQIQERLGTAYPPVTAQALLARAEAFRRERQYVDAQSALESAIRQLAGEDREKAQVQVAAVLYDRGQTSAAQSMLTSLSFKSADADAERLYYLVQCARKLKQEAAMLQHAKTLRQKYPNSEWTMHAHRWAGNHYIVDNNTERYVPLFKACADAQPRNPESAYCHWKVAWHAYLNRKPEAFELMSAHLERYPQSDKYAAALLFLGRLAEAGRRIAAARAYYEEVITVEPLSFYAELAAASLQSVLFKDISPDVELAAILVSFRGKPLRESFHNLEPLPETKRRIDRAALLARVDFSDWVELELRSYETTVEQRQFVAMALADGYYSRGDYFRAIRTMKSMAPGYFRLRLEQAPRKFWELLFPMPYAETLAKHSATRNIDPYVVAGLIRQESEYRPDAVSRAKAYGLMQVMPATGRSLARSLGLGSFSVSMLTQPEVNLNMGTYYFASLGRSFDGRLEYALASYNAGKSRADRWKTWGNFNEPIEFIETIPFTETREYVLSVFRNAMVYRAVYPDLTKVPARVLPAVAKTPAVSMSPAAPKSSAAPAARKASASKTTERKTTPSKSGATAKKKR